MKMMVTMTMLMESRVAAAMAAGTTLLVVAAIICHRLWLHNLARYPGPFLARLSSFPNWYHAASGDRHEWLYRLHTRHGPVVRFAPNCLSFNTAEAFDAIYKSPRTNVIKSDWYQCVRDSAGGFESTFTARQTARHAAKRRLLSQAFSERALRDYEPRICAHIEAWIEAIQDEMGDGDGDGDGGLVDIDLGQWSNYLIFDILGDLGYGSSFGLVTTATNRSMVDLIPKATGGWYSLGYHPFTKPLRRILFQTPLGAYLGGPSYHHNIQFRTFCLSKLRERRQKDAAEEAEEPAPPRDMFTHLLHGQDPETGEGYSTGDLACESVLLMVAGSQSTAGGLAAIFFYLAHHPAKLARLRAEIHGAFAREQDIRYEYASCALATLLPYLRACVNESLRLSPPTPGHLPRDVVGRPGAVAMIDGHAVPGGTTVGVSPYALHRNPSYFRDALDFVPERWLAPKDGDGRGGPMVMGMVGFAAFSGGPTGCIGQQLAMVEMSLAVARLLWRFDLRLPRRRRHSDSSSPVEFVAKDRFVGQAEGPRVRLVVSCPARQGEAD